jgi:2-polyprenyl-3-methyl-5-hydroxy-6-metoxy-1,4-benzoquinol methylase
MEDEPCFCGASKDKDVQVSAFDRHGIPHKMVICKDCGLMRANPRMTAESYTEFYDKEYRKIYREHTIDNDDLEQTTDFLGHIQGGMSILEFADYFDIKKKVVVDIGCNMGGHLLSFKEAGSEVYGVDYDSISVEYGKSKGLNLTVGNIDEMKLLDIKADIIIMNHVLEHCLDLRKELDDIKSILSPDGVLFLGVPGIYSWPTNSHLIWQNAHVWQFTADTLEYVMNSCGWDAWHLDEKIWSVWKPEKRDKSDLKKPSHTVEYTTRFLRGERTKLPEMRTMNKFTVKERKNYIEENLKYRFPNMAILDGGYDDCDAVIVAGGPSVNGYEKKIKELQKKGAKVITIERMYDWCHDNGITPDFAVILDACDDVVDGLQNIRGDTKWLIGSTSSPDASKILKDEEAYIFFTAQKGIKQHELWYQYGYDKVRVINSGGSVSLASISLSMALGMRNIHVFGFDCHVTNGDYAKGIKGEGVKRGLREIR